MAQTPMTAVALRQLVTKVAMRVNRFSTSPQELNGVIVNESDVERKSI